MATSSTNSIEINTPTSSLIVTTDAEIKRLYRKELISKFVFGGISCMVGSFITNPIDIIKVRLQLQGEGLQQAKNLGFVGIGRNMIRQEGILSVYKGVSASMWREATYSTIRYGCYDLYKDFAKSINGGKLDDQSFAIKAFAGLAAGMTGSAVANPSDVIKIRMQAYQPPDKPPRYRSVGSAFAQIYRTEGLAGLYRGVGPTTARAGVLTMSQLATYDETKQYILRHGYLREGFFAHFTSSMIAGLVCSLTSNPIDVIKVRLMNQPYDSITKKGTKYVNAFDCLRKTIMAEGPLALYKGFFMCWMRLGPHTTISLIIFEQLRRFSGINPI